MTDRFVFELLGAMAYGELSAFERLSSDARFSPTLQDRAALGRMAVAEFRHFELVSDRLADLGHDAEAAMRPFQVSVDAFHDRTRPADWYESIMKAYVIDTISADFYSAVSQFLDAPTRDLVAEIQDPEESSVLQARLRGMVRDDPRLASRLALWGRRLVGEALTQAQRLSLEGGFLPEGVASFQGPLMAELTKNHSRRMSQLGLTA
ncbi:ferritin-like fold-containing protein [Psychromicrobium sp. YIM B11713]|uniref:ferritin-like fold-containing protein n=1 Tax=Psychromicrobium sp. YIM B11713 TaxID=3145233 RepID=UPI00374FAA8A